MEPQSQREAEREAGRKRFDHWEEFLIVKYPLTRESRIEVVTKLLVQCWAVRLRPGMFLGQSNHETIWLWLHGLERALICVGLEPPDGIDWAVHARRKRFSKSANSLPRTMYFDGLSDEVIVDEVLSLKIEIFETWLRILNDDWTWNRELLHQTLCRFPGASREYPFDATTGAYKVGGKTFALVAEDADPLTITLKSEPDRAVELRRAFACVAPDFHRSKRHWNTITLDGSVRITDIWQWMQDSYDLVFGNLKSTRRKRITRRAQEERF